MTKGIKIFITATADKLRIGFPILIPNNVECIDSKRAFLQ